MCKKKYFPLSLIERGKMVIGVTRAKRLAKALNTYRIQGFFMTETFKKVWDALERDQAERERKFRAESETRAF